MVQITPAVPSPFSLFDFFLHTPAHKHRTVDLLNSF